MKHWPGDPPSNLAVLEELDQRGTPVGPPIRTTDGRLATHSYAVFPFISGNPGPENPALLGRTLRQVHAITDVALPAATMDEPSIGFFRAHVDHPWIRDRRDELERAGDRLEAVIDLDRETEGPHALVHDDLYGDNLIVNDDLDLIAILDWDHACLGPREHDLWTLADEQRSDGLLAAYGERDLDATAPRVRTARPSAA